MTHQSNAQPAVAGVDDEEGVSVSVELVEQSEGEALLLVEGSDGLHARESLREM